MKLAKLLFGSMFMISAFTLGSCVEDDDFATKPNTEPKSENYIAQSAINFAKSIKHQATTRTMLSSSNSLYSLSVQELNLKNQLVKTRSTETTPKFFTVALSENSGTVLVAAKDNKAMPLAYFMKENNLDANELLKDTLSDLSFLVQTIINENSDRTITTSATGTDENTIIEHIDPKCKVAWHQRTPYNRYCFTSSGKQALAGCVAIAAAQALTVLQPNNFPGITSWEEIVKPYPSEATIDEIARLVRYMGKVTGIKYGTSESGTSKTPSKLFKEYGIVDYDCGRVIDVLNTQHGIVYITGYRAKHGWGPWRHVAHGHAFLADGYVRYNRSKDPYYLHLKYGWLGGDPKDVYLLSANKHWKEKEAKEIYGRIYPYKLYYYTYTYETEKFW
ncbi:MAG: C10 family peptidase [Prevotella nigrescens]|jgi:putative pyrogenic exotoxin B|nr:C10 family peptidase [Prevotella nigrescens]